MEGSRRGGRECRWHKKLIIHSVAHNLVNRGPGTFNTFCSNKTVITFSKKSKSLMGKLRNSRAYNVISARMTSRNIP